MRSDRLQHSKLHGRYACPVNFRQVRGKYTVCGIPVIKSSAPAQYNHASTLCGLRSTMPAELTANKSHILLLQRKLITLFL